MSPTTKDAGIEKLDGSNYKLWSYKMMMVLMSKGLWVCVSSSRGCSPHTLQKAHAEIVLRILDAQILHVYDFTTPEEVWKKLKSIHEGKNVASRMWLKEKFSSFRYTSTSMEKHIEELESLTLSMASAGCKPDEDDVCIVLLRSLPAKYESLVQAYRMNVVKISFSDIVNRLIAEDIRQN